MRDPIRRLTAGSAPIAGRRAFGYFPPLGGQWETIANEASGFGLDPSRASTLATSAQNLDGTYAVDGTNLDGSPYKGTAEIRIVTDTTCEIYWTTGSTTSEGFCMRNGPALAAGYILGQSVGLVIYRIMDDGSLDGLWTVAGQNGNGTEKLTPQ